MNNIPVFVLQPDLGGLLSLAVVIVLPILVGLVTTRVTRPGWQAVLLLFLSAVTSVTQTALADDQNNMPFAWQPVVFNAAVNFGVAVAVHFGLWRPTGVAERAVNTGVTDR